MSEIKLDAEHLETSQMTSRIDEQDAGVPVVLDDEELGWVAGGRKVNEYEGQHR
ncbi:hypothetical protein [Microvirga puerhi]|uniref:Benenodin family lasso peptide n=1 Tax=Microvirga puerhi TaxID=2876078 RepID=A0ABS7VIG8_9HYPH|nr:hypothetical protein [Microvirga puerhi]MBZ6074768.1 hypothetical protein [Microvirga puerhi]